MDGIRATPMQYPILGLLADRLKRAQQFAVAPGGYANPPAEILLNLLGVPAIQQTMERVAYGEPLTTGRGMTTQIRPEVAEAAMTLLPAAAGTARVAERGAMAAGRAGERMAERMVPQIMERGGMPAGLLEGMSSRTVSPLTVYHGSPAKFTKFDPTKIGSGEGAQAYGYGHYVAESPGVAKEYQKRLSSQKNTLTDEQNLRDSLSSELRGVVQQISSLKPTISYSPGAAKRIEELSAKENILRKEIDKLTKIADEQLAGSFYEIDLPDEQIAKMLDWDKPLSKQPNILKALETHPTMGKESLGWKGAPEGLWEKAMSLPSKTGEWLYREMQGNIPIETSEALRQAGIPGIRYLDQGSRGTGGGTSNFVVFPGNEGLLTIQKRNNEVIAPTSLLDYRGSHTAPGPDFGAPLHDLTGGGQMYPPDVYSPKAAQYYGGGVPYDQKAFDIAQSFKDKPNAMVTIYRAVPKEMSNSEKLAALEKEMAAYMKRGTLPKDAENYSSGSKWYDWAYDERERLRNLPDEPANKMNINAGDWVTLTKEYAKDHGESALKGQYKILSKKVRAKDLWTNADSIHEFGYHPQ